MKNKTGHCLTTGEITDQLQEAGVQPTAQRIAICRYVLCDADHPTADDVKAWADKNFPKMSLATVYNTLNTLVEAGLLREFRFSHSNKVIYDSNTDDHFHFLDESSGQIIDIEKQMVRVNPKLAEQFQVQGVEVLLRGKRVSQP